MRKIVANPLIYHAPPGAQGGAVMIIGLIMVLLMSIIALAAIRGSGMQELMAGNMRDRNLAFQSAEAGLRDAESVLNQDTIPPFDGSAVGYVQALQGATGAGYWRTYNWDNSVLAEHLELEWITSQPRYVIEEVNYLVTAGAEGGAIDFESSLNASDATLYRVTSRGLGGTESAAVILQSTYKR